ncbi:MAG: C-GCAxxG-C-C family protein [Desulfobulbaceae bacterium]|nr:C-GCAxxG-C-C family protein [Desulfobulbaceae bacterium]
MEEKHEAEAGVSRRNFLSGTGKLIAGTAIASSVLASQADKVSAYPFETGFKYVKLDPAEVGRITYENYFKRWCAASVVAGFAEQLQTKVGGLWKTFPIDSVRWAHGGFAGWGALCGTMSGAGTIVGLVTNDTDIAEEMCNDLAFYYSYTELPSYSPAKPIKATIKNMTMAGTPVCHISVGKWMKSEGAAFLDAERAERCARLAANVAMETCKMLNDWVDGKYKAKHKPLFNVAANGITSQNNCRDCHGSNVPVADTYATLEK